MGVRRAKRETRNVPVSAETIELCGERALTAYSYTPPRSDHKTSERYVHILPALRLFDHRACLLRRLSNVRPHQFSALHLHQVAVGQQPELAEDLCH